MNPRLVGTRWHFEYGPAASYGSVSPELPGDLGNGDVAVAV